MILTNPNFTTELKFPPLTRGHQGPVKTTSFISLAIEFRTPPMTWKNSEVFPRQTLMSSMPFNL